MAKTNYGIRGTFGAFTLVLLTAACGSERPPASRLDPALAKYIASDALAVGSVDLERLRSAPFYLRHRQEFSFLDQGGTGNHLLFIWNGRTLLVAGISGTKAVSLSGEQGAISAAQNAVRSKTGKLPNELLAPLSWLPATDQIWAASIGLPVEGVPLPSVYASLLSNFRGYIRTTAAGLTVDEGLHLRARIDCVSEAGSRRVGDALRAAIGLGRLTAKQNDSAVYEALSTERTGPTVFVRADYPPELAERVLAMLAGRPRR